MDLSKILAISGKSGLFKIVSRTKGGMIVESLADGKKMPVFAAHRSSLLEDISIFSYTDDIPLKKVLWTMYEKEGGKKVLMDAKEDGSQLQAYFEQVLPDFDKDRVYTSDIRKVIGWYNQLLDHNLITPPQEEKDAANEQGQSTATDDDHGKADIKDKAQPKKDQAKHTPKVAKAAKPLSKTAAPKIVNTKQSKKS